MRVQLSGSGQSFNGLTINSNVPSKIRKAIVNNEAIEIVARKFDLEAFHLNASSGSSGYSCSGGIGVPPSSGSPAHPEQIVFRITEIGAGFFSKRIKDSELIIKMEKGEAEVVRIISRLKEPDFPKPLWW